MVGFKILFAPSSWFPCANGQQNSWSTPHSNSFLYSHAVHELDHSAHGVTITGTHIEETGAWWSDTEEVAFLDYLVKH